jgi:hypothetical protein
MSDFAKAFAVLATAKAWPKNAGSRVTEAQLAAAAAVLKRTGTAKHLGLAMYLRNEGATQGQVYAATGDTQVNVARDLIANGKALAVTMQPANGTGHKVYKLALYPNGAPAPKGKGNGKAAKPAAKGAGKATGGKALKPTAKRQPKPAAAPVAKPEPSTAS